MWCGRARGSSLSVAAAINLDILHIVIVNDAKLSIAPPKLSGIVTDLLDHSGNAIAENYASAG